jgi:hypothetical protein
MVEGFLQGTLSEAAARSIGRRHLAGIAVTYMSDDNHPGYTLIVYGPTGQRIADRIFIGDDGVIPIEDPDPQPTS